MRRFVSSLLVASALLTFAACKEDPQRPPAAGDLPQAPPMGGGAGGGGGEGGVDAGDDDAGDAGACTVLPNEGVIVDQNGIVGDAPTGSGGTIQEGTYELTAANVYVGAAGIPGPTGQVVQARCGSPGRSSSARSGRGRAGPRCRKAARRARSRRTAPP